MSETAAGPVAAPVEPVAEVPAEPEAPAAPEPAPVAPDHEGMLHELAAHIRTVAASPAKDVTELLAWLASHHL